MDTTTYVLFSILCFLVCFLIVHNIAEKIRKYKEEKEIEELKVREESRAKVLNYNNDIIDYVTEEICDNYCQYQQLYGYDEACEYILNEHCAKCPLNELSKIRS